MKADELRKKFIEFFVEKGHKQIPSSSLVPENDPTTLFTGSGMQPLIPYLMGEKHPLGKRLVNSQICFRTEDIEEIGDNRHTTFFEMLGNWSLGDYFKEKQLGWFFEFLTKEVGLDPEKLYVTVFEGNSVVPKDKESIRIWQELFDTKEPVQKGIKGFNSKTKIYSYGAAENWWSRSGVPQKMPVGEIGGPDSEVFYDFGPELKLHEKSSFKNKPCHLNCECGRFLEIGNSVFMEYKKTKTGFEKLPQRNVDFGGGLERILAAKNNNPDIFKTDLFWPIIQEIEKSCDKKYKGNEESMRVICDHLKASVFMAREGLEPSNKKEGYLMRRLIRRMVVKMRKLNIIPLKILPDLCGRIINIYDGLYFDKKPYEIHPIIGKEISSFERTIHKGTKLLQTQQISGKLLFDLYQSCGFPLEISQEFLEEWGKPVTKEQKEEFDRLLKKHQEKSRTASKGMFKGGLADHSEKIKKLHTATHLLHSALRKVLGEHTQQTGSNITSDRLRFDFTHPEKLSSEEIKKIEDLVNEQIKKNLKVNSTIMSLTGAQKQGALAFFGQKYPDKVKVYSIGPSTSFLRLRSGQAGQAFSLEVCGGPHVDFTGKLGEFRIKKEESCGSGKRRVYAVLGSEK